MNKKIFRYFLVALGIMALLLIGSITVIYFKGIPRYSVQPIDFKVEKSSANIEKGKKIALMKCYSCHFDSNTGQFTGHFLTNIHPSFGRIYASNITNHKETGIGSWTDGELAFFLRTGIRPNGTFVPQYMPKLVHTSDSDLAALIAFLRSDDTLVRANGKIMNISQPSLKTKILTNISPYYKAIDYPKEEIKQPSISNEIEFGKYLVLNYECATCHSSNSKSNNKNKLEASKDYLRGGNQLSDKNGNLVLAPSILLDRKGIGHWSEEEFIQSVKFGIHPMTKEIFKEPMQAYGGLTDEEIKAIYAYLGSVSPIQP